MSFIDDMFSPHPQRDEVLFAVVSGGNWGRLPSGYVLCSDGRIYLYKKATLNTSWNLLGTNSKMAEEVAELIKVNDNRISALPEDTFCQGITDGCFTEILFSGKLCVSYMIEHCPDTEEIIFWHNEIINHIRQYGYLQDYPLLERRS
jgi:hypothetical protein